MSASSYFLLRALGMTVVEVPGLGGDPLMDYARKVILVPDGLDEADAERVTCAALAGWSI